MKEMRQVLTMAESPGLVSINANSVLQLRRQYTDHYHQSFWVARHSAFSSLVNLRMPEERGYNQMYRSSYHDDRPDTLMDRPIYYSGDQSYFPGGKMLLLVSGETMRYHMDEKKAGR